MILNLAADSIVLVVVVERAHPNVDSVACAEQFALAAAGAEAGAPPHYRTCFFRQLRRQPSARVLAIWTL